ncbi:MAG: hypothetical protein P9E88_12220 [Candidatus Competibacter sp.]|jgi:hypothetical protein|nr:hypothetical protein [Candidatus Competibacter sp.]
MNKRLLIGVAAFCTMGFSAGAWATNTTNTDEVVVKVRKAAVEGEIVSRVATNIASAEPPDPQSGCYVWIGGKLVWVNPCPY